MQTAVQPPNYSLSESWRLHLSLAISPSYRCAMEIVFHYFFFIWWFLPCFFLFNFTVDFYSRLMLLSSIFTVDFPDCVPSQKKKEAERKKPRPTSPGNTGLTHFHSYNHIFFYKSHATSGSASQKELDCPKSQGHPRLQMSCAHHGMKPTPSIPFLVALRHFY